MALLPNCPFQHPRTSIYILIVVARFRMLPSSSWFAPRRLNRHRFCIISSPFPLPCVQKGWLWYYANGEYNKNITAFVHIVLCFELMDRTADWLSITVLGYKNAFVDHPFLRLCLLIRSVDFQKAITPQGHRISPSFSFSRSLNQWPFVIINCKQC